MSHMAHSRMRSRDHVNLPTDLVQPEEQPQQSQFRSSPLVEEPNDEAAAAAAKPPPDAASTEPLDSGESSSASPSAASATLSVPAASGPIGLGLGSPALGVPLSRHSIDQMALFSQTAHHNRRQSTAMHFLPDCFPGAVNLQMPAYLKGSTSSVTLPSRLATLGRREFRWLAALFPRKLGNGVVGFSFAWKASNRPSKWFTKRFKKQLYLLPWLFSRALARMFLYLRLMTLILFAGLVIYAFSLYPINIGRAWVIGVTLAVFVMVQLATQRYRPEGVMVFLRSLGIPETEEYMFSYSWKVQAENIRTIAKGLYNAGVGVWIDTVKLVPGDEIGPLLRTTVAKVYRVVLFLSPEYISSPNCCIELQEAIQTPSKCTFVILKEIPTACMEYLRSLPGAKIVFSLDELIQQLDSELQDAHDFKAYEWWRAQRISSISAPKNCPPENWNIIPKFSLLGKLWLPRDSLAVGPLFLAGNCRSQGTRFAPPVLFLLAVAGAVANIIDLYLKLTGDVPRTFLDFVWLICIAFCNLAPFFAFQYLFETRNWCHVALKPLLSSQSMIINNEKGVKVEVIGNGQDVVVQSLRFFFAAVGHAVTTPHRAIGEHIEGDTDTAASKERTRRVVTVYVVSSIEDRDRLFHENLEFDPFALFVWNGPAGVDPFTPDENGQRMMKFLVLHAQWERSKLAENLLSAIAVRVVDIMHNQSIDAVPVLNEVEMSTRLSVLGSPDAPFQARPSVTS